MYWFHVIQKVLKYATDMSAVFDNLYDMQYALRHDFEAITEHTIAKWRDLTRGPSVHNVIDHAIRREVNSQRFAKGQAFYTPKGYAATNNPLKQQHRRLKVECPDGPQSPHVLIKGLGRGNSCTVRVPLRARALSVQRRSSSALTSRAGIR
ncbi:hypothetical protein JG688_00008447 [Phytophthora aleatoria]|uniref:Uncharacterized protein n=1 Tax=Phytophthora aleatoria TaxID=2496075 RepID=A0A8J5IR42_9STRA|nr:hypothetical protein JG688_00008447 [Phytophthora aleatoria]